jgi:Zeta toxin
MALTPDEIEDLWRVHTGPIAQSARTGLMRGFDDTRSWVDPNGYRLSDRLWQQSQEVRKNIDNQIRSSLAAGGDAIQMSKRVEQYLNPAYAPLRTVDGRILRDGRVGVLTSKPRGGVGSYPARRLMRTETTRAHGQSQMEVAKKFPSLIRWETSGSHPGPDTCDVNADRDSGHGSGLYLPKDVPTYPEHPHCLCTLQVVSVESDQELVERLRREYLIGDSPEEWSEEGYNRLRDTPLGGRPGMGDRSIGREEWEGWGRSTAQLHSRVDDAGRVVWSKERQQLHDQIVREHLRGVPRSNNPTFNMMGGGPASGKSTMEKAMTNQGLMPARGTAVKVDPDAIKATLPEYRTMTKALDSNAAAFAHEESSYLAKRVQRAGIETNKDVVLDGVGKKFRDVRDWADQSGYRMAGQYAFVDPDEAYARMLARYERGAAKGEGRLIPEDYFWNSHREIPQMFPDAVNAFDEISLMDTTVFGEPVLVARGTAGNLQILDEDRYAFFRDIANRGPGLG